jgi:methionyl aminopeptidase
MENVLSYDEMVIMKKAGTFAARILTQVKKMMKPGLSTKDVELFFDNVLKEHPDMQPAFKGYNNYPASLCVSVNEEIIHGVPSSKRVFKSGDLVSVDLGIKHQGLFVDTAFTYTIGNSTPLARKLIGVCRGALREAVKRVKVGSRIGDISSAVQTFVEQHGFSVIRNFVGHGIGRVLHCYPEVPNFGEKNTGEVLREGMVLAIEPMISSGSYEVEILSDGWTAKTKDNSLSCHFEHTVAVTKRGAWVLTQ